MQSIYWQLKGIRARCHTGKAQSLAFRQPTADSCVRMPQGIVLDYSGLSLSNHYLGGNTYSIAGSFRCLRSGFSSPALSISTSNVSPA
jgi:hypothetical protein